MSFEIARAGWMFRLSSILKRWKKTWVVLYHNGTLRYFENPDCPVAEESFSLPKQCGRIESGSSVNDSDPPSGCSKQSLLALHLVDKRLVFCAESPDDCSAWQIAFEQARVLGMQRSKPDRPPAYSPYGQAQVPGFPGQTEYAVMPDGRQRMCYCNCPDSGMSVEHGAQVNHVVQNTDGTRTNVIYVQHECPRHYSYGSDMAVGMMTGAALGSMMWAPMLWW